MEERFTLKQVLMMTCDMLRGIGSIPIELSERIGVPIDRAIRNLNECVATLNREEKRIAEEAAKNEQEENDGNADIE